MTVANSFCRGEPRLEALSVGSRQDVGFHIPGLINGTYTPEYVLNFVIEENGGLPVTTREQLAGCLGKIAAGDCHRYNQKEN